MNATNPNFRLTTWENPARDFRFLGWRDDFSAFYVLGESDKVFVLIPARVGSPESPRYSEPPTRIIETRLLPPPWRATKGEADLLRNARRLFYGRAQNYQQVVEAYVKEAIKRGIKTFSPPEQWELVYDDAISPKVSPRSRDNVDKVRDNTWKSWAKRHRINLKGMVDERATFTRLHGDDITLCARVRYRMEFETLVSVWLEELRGPLPPTNSSDLKQIQELCGARPELLHLSPDKAEGMLGLKPDKKHRTLKGYCQRLGLNVARLTHAHIPMLKLEFAHGRDKMKQGGKTGQLVRQAKTAKATAGYQTESRYLGE